MFLLVELKASLLDVGMPVSPVQMLLLLAMILWAPMIPYLFLYFSVRDEPGMAPTSLRATPILDFTTKAFRKMIASMHPHRHPEPLHR